ncbi:MAG: SURF1 family protein [Pacificimonas sp.]
MKLPLVPTLMVVLAMPILIALGLWQLGRADEKAAMLRALAAAPAQPTLIVQTLGDPDIADFRTVRLHCDGFGQVVTRAGRDEFGRSGFAYYAPCEMRSGDRPEINLGFAPRPDVRPDLPAGTTVTGTLRLSEDPASPTVVIADPPLGDLAQARIPTPDDIPDNHLGYAWQWFGFAAVLAIIYIIFVRGWRRGRQV